MGGLKPEISEGIHMFRPQSLKEAISLARMRVEQLMQQQKFSRAPSPLQASPTPSMTTPLVTSFKRLTWDEMQKRRTQRLCFNCNERFTLGNRCQVPRLLLLEGHDHDDDEVSIELQEPYATKAFANPRWHMGKH